MPVSLATLYLYIMTIWKMRNNLKEQNASKLTTIETQSVTWSLVILIGGGRYDKSFKSIKEISDDLGSIC